MTTVSIALSAELFQKLQTLSAKSGRPVEDCLELAVAEYVENYEDAYKTDLNSVNALERSFFFSVAE